MGQTWTSMRTMMAYSQAQNRRDAVASAKLRLGSTEALKWYRLDDGVMGGRSSTQHTTEGGALTFAGEVTASVRCTSRVDAIDATLDNRSAQAC